MLPTQKTPPKPNLNDLTLLVHGPHKYGKTTWCAQADGALFLATEPGLNHLEVYQQPISTWDELLAAAKEIAEGKHEFRTIVIDTIDNAYRMCGEYICRKYEVEHESDLEYGKGYALVNGEFHRVLNKLALLPYGLFLVSHSQGKEIETRTGKYTKVVPTLPDKARKLVLGLVDIILFCDLEPTTGADGKPAYRRVLRTKPSIAYEAGDRTGRLPEVLDLNFAAFAAAFARGFADGPAAGATPASGSTLVATSAGTPTAAAAAPTATAATSSSDATPPPTSEETPSALNPTAPMAGAASVTSSGAVRATPVVNARPTVTAGPSTTSTTRPRNQPAVGTASPASSPRARAASAGTTANNPATARPRTTSTGNR
jgi:hypothetical protein